MKKIPSTAILVAIIILAPLVLLSPILLDPDVVLAFNDGNIEYLLSSAFNYPDALFRTWNDSFFFGLGGGAFPLNMGSALETLLGPHHFRRIGVLIAIWFTAAAFYWTARQFRLSKTAALLTALLAMLCGWNLTFPFAGLPARSFVLAFSAISLGFIRRSSEHKSLLEMAVAGGFLGLAISDSPDVGLLFAVSCGLFLVTTNAWPLPSKLADYLKIATRCVVYVVCCLLVAYQVIAVMFATNISGVSQGASESPAERYEWATQWSLPPAETVSLFVNDFHGASSRTPENPYWGEMGSTAGWEKHHQGFRNFRLSGYALGIVSLALIVPLLVLLCRSIAQSKYRRGDAALLWTMLSISLLALVLSWGKYTPVYYLFYQLPFMGTIRNPEKWLGPFSMFYCLFFGYAVDFLFSIRENAAQKKQVMPIAKVLWGVIFVGIILMLAYLLSKESDFVATLWRFGYSNESLVIWNNALKTSGVAGIFLLLIIFVINLFLHEKQIIKSELVAIIIGLLISLDLLKAAQPFVIKHNYKELLKDNPLTVYLDRHINDGRIKLLPAQHPLLNNWRLTLLMSRDYAIFDPVSVSRMPNDYKTFFDAFNNNPARLWQLGSIRYFITLADYLSQLQGISPSFVDRGGIEVGPVGESYLPTRLGLEVSSPLRLVEYKDALPLVYAVNSWNEYPNTPDGDQAVLKSLTRSTFDPTNEAVVQIDAKARKTKLKSGTTGEGGVPSVLITSNRSFLLRATVSVNSSNDVLLVRTVKYHPNWQVFIDNKPAELLRANYLFQGVTIPPGKHEVLFEYKKEMQKFWAAIAGRIVILLLVLGVLLKYRNRNI